MDIKGTIVEINSTETKGASAFQVRTFAIEVVNPINPQYNDTLQFQLTGQRCPMLDTFKVGQLVDVKFGIQGRKWVGNDNKVRYFTTLVAWNVTSAEQPQVYNPPTGQDNYADLDFSASPMADSPF